MASMSIMISDSENGIMSSSANFTEEEMRRILASLKAVYLDQFEAPPTTKDIFAMFASSMILHTLHTAYETELELKMEEFKKQIQPIEPK